jgi:hypothetical protein
LNQLMLLAQLCGDGKSTEDQLRNHGFTDLPAVAGAGAEHLAVILGISENAARRMVNEATRMMAEAGVRRGVAENARGESTTTAPPVTPPVTLSLAGRPVTAGQEGGGGKRAPGEGEEDVPAITGRKHSPGQGGVRPTHPGPDAEVTHAEVEGLRHRKKKHSRTGKAGGDGRPDAGPGKAPDPGPREELEPSFWRFG